MGTRRNRASILAVSGATALAVACASSTPERPAVTVKNQFLPAGCERNLSGLYAHAEEPGYRYRVQDDGSALVMTVEGKNGVTVKLERTPHGFVGSTHASGLNAARQNCPVTFATQLTGCSAEALTFESVMAAAVDETCQISPSAAGGEVERHRLLFLEKNPGDARVTDAGS